MVSADEAHPEARHAVTHYRTIARAHECSVLEITLETGRKNQIRAHLSEKGHPVVGDTMYGATINPLDRLGLHAKLRIRPSDDRQKTELHRTAAESISGIHGKV